MSIRAQKISKKFYDFQALQDISLSIEQGEFLALLGPSGSGKTTLLRVLAGLELPDTGDVFIEGEEIHEKPVRERNIGFVFQHYALFRHMTVFENVAFGLRIREKEHRPSAEEIEKRVGKLLNLVHLDGVVHHYPSQLSGGQRQRVALARVLAVEPRVMFLDEPFGALDAKVRKELRQWMRRLHDEMNITTIFVTHDQEEAMEIADRIAILNKGKIVQIGTPEEIWNNPADAFVYDFLGNYNGFIADEDQNGNLVISDDLFFPIKKKMTESIRKGNSLLTKFKNFVLSKNPDDGKDEEENKFLAPPSSNHLKLFVRPFELSLHKTKFDEGMCVAATITHINKAGSVIKIELIRPNGHILQAELTKESFDELNIVKNETVWVYPRKFRVFD